MNIRATVACSLALATAIMLAIVAIAVHWVLLGQFATLEDSAFRSELAGLEDALAVRFKDLDQRTVDWSMWGECHAWFADPQPAFLEELATPAWMNQIDIDLIALIALDGTVRDGRMLDDLHQRVLSANTDIIAALGLPLLWQHGHEDHAVTGVMSIAGEPWLIASRPSLTDAGLGPIAGTVLMGRRLDHRLYVGLARGADRRLDLRPAEGDLVRIEKLDAQRIIGRVEVPQLGGGPGWYLTLEVKRELWQQGVRTWWLVLVVIVLVTLVVAGLVWYLLEARVCSRIAGLEQQINGISTAEERVDLAGDDELARLGSAFNKTLDDLGRANRELATARDDAVAAAHAKADLLAAVSHELRTPLNGILGMVRLLGEAPLGREQRDLLDVMRTSGDNLLVLVNDILDVSRLEAGRMELETMVFDCRTVVEDALLLHAERAQAKGLALSAVIDSSLPRHVNGDPGRFRQIIHNLVGNAVKFTEKGEITVRLLPEPSLSTSGQIGLRLLVRDTGIGIPRAVQERLFQRYTQGDSSTARRYGGSGLGLSICKQLAERMGGGITLESISGAGSTIAVTVRMGRIEAAPGSEPGLINGGMPRILLIDPHAATREGLRHALRGLGYDVDEAETLEQARLLIFAGGAYVLALAASSCCDPAHAPEAVVAELRAVLGEHRLMLLVTLDERARYAGIKGVGAVLSKPVRRAHLREALLRLSAPGRHGSDIIDPADEDSGSRSTLRVLVVDDSHINQRVAAGMLKRLGCTVDVAANGLEGLEALRRRRYDLVILDCQMPVMDGYVMAEQWRREEDPDRRILLVALTADATVGARDRCLSAGMDDYLVKPIDIDLLASTVRRAVGRRSDGSGKLPALCDVERVRAASGELDRALLDQVRILGDDGYRRVIDRYLEAMPDRLDQLAAALDAANATRTGSIAHQIVGESGLVGLRRVEHLAREIELAARSDGRLLDAHLIPLREAFSRGSALLLVARDEPGPPPDA